MGGARTTSRRSAALAVVLVLAVVAVGCVVVVLRSRGGAGGADTATGQPASVTTLQLPGAPASAAPVGGAEVQVPAIDGQSAATAVTAVTSYLTARRDDALDLAYVLLSPASRARYPSPAAWRNAVVDLPAPVTFTLAPGAAATPAGTEITVDVRRRPALDAFGGFVAAQTSEVYRAVSTDAGWRVDAAPVRAVAVLPPDVAAQPAVQGWLDRVSACDGPGAVAGQVTQALLGDDSLTGALCADRQPLVAGPAQLLSGGPEDAPFLASYGPGVGVWARIVPVTGSGDQLLVAVAPLGATWRVFGIVSGTAS